ncbi:MAG: hypothetical protein CML06_08220 [Pseudomonadales bacterium]|nr:hypothetical protein [Pseudomonadales bacterium]
MSEQFLTKEDLIEVTGYSQHSKQRKFLEEHGLRFLGKNGMPKITWKAIEHYFNSDPKPVSSDSKKSSNVKLNVHAFRRKKQCNQD